MGTRQFHLRRRVQRLKRSRPRGGQAGGRAEMVYDARHRTWRDRSRMARRAAQRKGRALDRQVQRKDRKSTRLNSSHLVISYAVFCLKKKKKKTPTMQSHRQ